MIKRPELMSWQWGLYPEGHQDKVNLLIHVLTWPLFVSGFLSLLASPLLGWPAAVGGLVGMVVAIAAQGRGHRREHTSPVPFEGPGDVVSRLLVEQLVTFPRYLVSGRFGQAWRQSGGPG
jgi:hypothetical protein